MYPLRTSGGGTHPAAPGSPSHTVGTTLKKRRCGCCAPARPPVPRRMRCPPRRRGRRWSPSVAAASPSLLLPPPRAEPRSHAAQEHAPPPRPNLTLPVRVSPHWSLFPCLSPLPPPLPSAGRSHLHALGLDRHGRHGVTEGEAAFTVPLQERADVAALAGIPLGEGRHRRGGVGPRCVDRRRGQLQR